MDESAKGSVYADGRRFLRGSSARAAAPCASVGGIQTALGSVLDVTCRETDRSFPAVGALRAHALFEVQPLQSALNELLVKRRLQFCEPQSIPAWVDEQPPFCGSLHGFE